MVHNRLFCTQFRFNLNSKKKFSTTNIRQKKTFLADQTVYVWDPEWSHIMFFNFPNDISSCAIDNVSVHTDYLRVTQLTTDTTPLNYNTKFNDRTSNNSLNSTLFITQKTLNGTRNLTQQDI